MLTLMECIRNFNAGSEWVRRTFGGPAADFYNTGSTIAMIGCGLVFLAFLLLSPFPFGRRLLKLATQWAVGAPLAIFVVLFAWSLQSFANTICTVPLF